MIPWQPDPPVRFSRYKKKQKSRKVQLATKLFQTKPTKTNHAKNHPTSYDSSYDSLKKRNKNLKKIWIQQLNIPKCQVKNKNHSNHSPDTRRKALLPTSEVLLFALVRGWREEAENDCGVAVVVGFLRRCPKNQK